MLQSSLRSKLAFFGRRRVPVERRDGKRIPPARHALCLIRHPGADESIAAVVHNLSFKGIALLTEREYPPGSLLSLLLINAAHTFSVEVELRIVRCFRLAVQQYFVAGPFERVLPHDEVVPLLQ